MTSKQLTMEDKRQILDGLRISLARVHNLGQDIFERTSCDRFYKNWNANEAMKEIVSAFDSFEKILERNEEF